MTTRGLCGNGSIPPDNLVTWMMISQNVNPNKKIEIQKYNKKKWLRLKTFSILSVWTISGDSDEVRSPRPYNPYFLSPLTSPSWYETSIDTCPEAWNWGGISGSPSKTDFSDSDFLIPFSWYFQVTWQFCTPFLVSDAQKSSWMSQEVRING